MCMNSMKNILTFVKSWGFFHFFPKWKGRKNISVAEITQFLPWLLPSIKETCQPCMGNTYKSQLHTLMLLQKKVIHNITKASYLDHMHPLFVQ